MPPTLTPGERTIFRCEDTGTTVSVPSRALLQRPSVLAKALRKSDVQGAWASEESQVIVNNEAHTYRFQQYPPLRIWVEWLVTSYIPSLRTVPLVSPLGLLCATLMISAGAFFLAGCAQVWFLFPCLSGFSLLNVGTNSYCVPSARLSDAAAASCGSSVADICSKRIPVTMQTYGVMLLGAIGGRAGCFATALYVLMVCIGAPFQAASGGVGKAMWDKGAIISSSGGFFWGFIAASAIMGRAVERGVGRGTSWRSILWLVPYMIAAEAAIYACGLTWLPFGMAIARNVSPSAICPESQGISNCLNNIFNWGMVPFLPGECFKMALILCTVPFAWSILTALHKWRQGYTGLFTSAEAIVEEDDDNDGEDEITRVKDMDAAGSLSLNSVVQIPVVV